MRSRFPSEAFFLLCLCLLCVSFFVLFLMPGAPAGTTGAAAHAAGAAENGGRPAFRTAPGHTMPYSLSSGASGNGPCPVTDRAQIGIPCAEKLVSYSVMTLPSA